MMFDSSHFVYWFVGQSFHESNVILRLLGWFVSSKPGSEYLYYAVNRLEVLLSFYDLSY